MKTPLLTILGATASGKTTVAVHCAMRMNGEIISADSRQVYRGMNIGTGKDLAEYTVNNTTVAHHLIDIAPAGYQYNVYEYHRDFERAYRDICARRKTPILCGGSGMYIEAAVSNYQLPPVPQDIALRASLEQLSTPELVAQLTTLGPLHNTSDTTHRKRLIRAIEIALHQSAVEEKIPRPAPLPNVYVGITFDREARRQRITERLRQRLREGMVEEVEQLLQQGIAPEALCYYGLEYKYITDFLTHRLTYAQMESQLNIAIHQFAKRQMTWFRGMERKGALIHWLDGHLPLEEKLQQIEAVYRGKSVLFS